MFYLVEILRITETAALSDDLSENPARNILKSADQAVVAAVEDVIVEGELNSHIV